MTIIVKKPFEPEPFADVKDIKDINTKVINAANEQQIHPEFEEKPVVESMTQTSEDVHGGSELTFSLPNSSQSSGQEQQQNGSTVNNQADQNGTSASNNADTNNDNTNDNAADNNGDDKGVQEQQNASGEKPNDNNEVGGGAQGTNNDGGSSQENVDNVNEHETTVDKNANAESSGDNQDNEDGNGNNDTEDQGQESSESASTDDEPGSGVDNQDGDGDTNDTNADNGQNQGNGDNETGDTNNEQNSGNGGEDDESEDTDDEQSQSGTYNTQQVVDVINAVSASSKYYQTEFYRFIELISEEKTRTFDPMGSDEYNAKKLMFRPYEKKPLSSYKMSRVRESVVILLDNSGSMRWWSDNLQILADLAMQRNDVEVYLAPNGYIEEMLYPKHQLVNHNEVMKRLRNRKIIYVGDFDGADTPIILSWYNDVIWVCPEERYLNFLDHDWVHYSEDKFKGAFLRVFTLQELFSAFKKLLSTPALKIWYDLCNETHKCGGDEE